MRGDDLLLLHLALLDDSDESEERPSAQERVEAELGPELARALADALAAR